VKKWTCTLVALAAVSVSAPVAAQAPDSLIAASHSNQTRFRVNVDGGMVVGGEYDGDGGEVGIPREGGGTRLMWYPRKAALRAGFVDGDQWDAGNIGDYSVAFGYNTRATADYAAAFGIRTSAVQVGAFAAGEDNIASGASSVALGYHAHTNNRLGSFVFSDRSSVDTLRAGVNNSANWRVAGGFRIYTAGNLSSGVTIQAGTSVSNWGQSSAVISTSTGASLTIGGVWQNASDVNRKQGFEDVSGEAVLAALRGMPIRTWSYKSEADTVRHLGPTSQDFRQAFGLGGDELSIGTVDADGVALLGVQTLERRTGEHVERIEALERRNAELREEVERLRAEAAAVAERLQQIEALLAPSGN